MSLTFSYQGTLKYDAASFEEANLACKKYFEELKEEETPEEYESIKDWWEESYKLGNNEIKIDLDYSGPSDRFSIFECIIGDYLARAHAGSLQFLMEGSDEPDELKAGTKL